MKRYILTIIIAAYGVCCHALPAEPDSLSRGRSYYDMAEEVLSMERYDYDGVLKLGHAAYSLLRTLKRSSADANKSYSGRRKAF